MVDNLVVASATSTGATVKTEDIGGVHFGVVKIYLGASGAADGPVNSGRPMPVSLSEPIAVSAATGVFAVSARNTVNIAGTVNITAANAPIPVTAAGGVFTVSARNTITVQGVVQVSAGNAPIPVSAAGGVSIPVSVASQPARSVGTDSIGAALATNVLVSGTESFTPKFATIDTAASGATILVSAVAARKIRVLTYALATKATVEARFRNDTTDITGPMPLVNGISGPNGYPVGLFETSVSADLVIFLGGAVSAAGHITYIEV